MNLRRLIPLFGLALAALACSLGANLAPTNVPGGLATGAAATLTALVPNQPAVTGTLATTPGATQSNSTPSNTETSATQPSTANTQPPAASATPAAPATALPAAATPTTAASATSITPACSLAYADNGSLSCLGSSGSPQTLATGQGLSGPRISPDGQLVAYVVVVTEGVTQLWVAGVTEGGAAPHLLVGQDKLPSADKSQINSPRHYEWLAGTHTLVFDTSYMPTGGVGGPGEYINADLWTVNADTDAVASVLKAGSAGAFAASPDGHTIEVSRGQGLDLVNADGSNYRQNVIKFPNIVTYSEYTYKPRAQWSADGTFFTVAIPSVDPLAANASVSIYKVGVDGTVEPKTKQAGNSVFGGSIAPQIAPNGQFAVFSRGDANGGPDVLHMLTLQPGAVGDNSFDKQTGPMGWGWAPDSTHYAYTVIPTGAAGKGFVTGTAAGTVQPLLANLTAIHALQWADSSTLVFIGQISKGDWSLYRQALGAQPQKLVGGLTDAATMDALPR